MKKLSLLLLLFGVLFGCSSKNYFVSPDYKSQKISNASLLISTVDEFKIRQADNLFDENELTLINKNFVNSLSSNLKPEIFSRTTLAKIDFADISSKVKLEEKNLPYYNNEQFKVNLPLNSVTTEEKNNVFILFIQDFSISIFKKERETSDPAKHFSVSNPTPTETKLAPSKLADQVLGCEFKYAIFDNTKMEPVSYGLIHFEKKFAENMEIGSMFEIVAKKMAEEVVKDTPFEI